MTDEPDDYPPLQLDADQQAYTDKCLKEIGFGVNNFIKYYREGTLDAEFAHNLLATVQMNIDQLSDRLGLPTESVESARLARQLAEQREAYIATLEAQLADRSDLAAAMAQVKRLAADIEQWWHSIGLGRWLDDFQVHKAGGLAFSLTTLLDNSLFEHQSDTPVTDRAAFVAHIAQLRANGWVLSSEQRHKAYVLVDCDANRQKLAACIRAQFPSAIIKGWHSLRIDKAGEAFYIRQVDVFIRDITVDTH